MFDLKHHPDEAPAAARAEGPEPRGPSLQCLRGMSAPEDLPADVASLCSLPPPLRERFFDLLAPYLAGVPSDEDQQRLFALCEEHAFDPQRLVGPIRGARFLIQSAARAALDEDAFAKDVARLIESDRVVDALSVLVPCFRRAAPELRRQIALRTIADHGRLVTDVNWRVDKIVNSEHGDGVNVPVAVLTFRYQEGAKEERITVHLLPEQLGKLKSACLEMLPDRARGGR